MKPLSKNIALFLLALVIISAVFARINVNTAPTVQQIAISDLAARINSGEITAIEVEEQNVTAKNAEGLSFITKKEGDAAITETLERFVSEDKLKALTITVKERSLGTKILQDSLPSAVLLIGLGVLLFVLLGKLQGANGRAMSFGQSGAREADKKNRVTFADIAGNPEAKEELAEVVEFLKMPKKFADLGAKVPRGVLLMGSPGTGKTLIARAVAGEAQVPFFHISGSEFVEMFVGVGASRVRDLFAKAKKAAPCIIFIDEIDAVGRQRGAGLGGGHDEREQTLNQILVEMDGFEANNGIIVIAATNRPDVLDPALLRPGRFDRRIVLDRPDLKSRKEILTIHTKGKPLAEDINIDRIAERTVGMSGADLANVMNEGAILAARRNKKTVEQADVLDAIEKVMLGPERKSHVLSEDERVLTAYHEAGHAIVGHLLPHCDDVHKISIISRGRAAGYTMSLPNEDRKMHSRQEFLDEMAMTLGGYVAEKEIFGDLTTGASNDLSKATALAKELVTRYGMSEKLGPRTYGTDNTEVFLGKQFHETRDYSEKYAEAIDNEVNELLNQALQRATEIIRTERERIDKLVAALIKEETIEKEAFESLVGPKVRAPKMQPKK